MEIKDLGLIAAMIVSENAPSETKVLWYDTTVNLHKYYDVIELVWKPLTFYGGVRNEIITTNSTAKEIFAFNVPDNRNLLFDFIILARRIDGVSGLPGDSVIGKGSYVAKAIGTTITHSMSFGAAPTIQNWPPSVAVTATNNAVSMTVKGATGNNIKWQIIVYSISILDIIP